MRRKLARMEEVRTTFTGTFARFGTKNGYRGPVKTVLLEDVHTSDGKQVTEHLWFNLTKGFDALGLQEGDLIEFRARVKEYLKGYMGNDWEGGLDAPVEVDYKLSHPTKVRLISRTASGG